MFCIVDNGPSRDFISWQYDFVATAESRSASMIASGFNIAEDCPPKNLCINFVFIVLLFLELFVFAAFTKRNTIYTIQSVVLRY